MKLTAKGCFSVLLSSSPSTVDSAETGPTVGVPVRDKRDDKECFTSSVSVYFAEKSFRKSLELIEACR